LCGKEEGEEEKKRDQIYTVYTLGLYSILLLPVEEEEEEEKKNMRMASSFYLL
jgi:hypothetical protein